MNAVDGPPPPPQGARPGSEARACDPIAAALGNASLLGVGYTTSKYYPSGIVNVTFHKQKYRIRVYELRTGKLVAKTTRQIGRGGCSRYVYYTYYEEDIPPTKEYVATTGWEIRAMYRPFINP